MKVCAQIPNDQDREVCTAHENSIVKRKPTYREMKLRRSKTDPSAPLGTSGAEKARSTETHTCSFPHFDKVLNCCCAAALSVSSWLTRQSEATHLAFFFSTEAVYAQKNTNHDLLEVRISEELKSPKKDPLFQKQLGKGKRICGTRQCAIYIRNSISFFSAPFPQWNTSNWNLIYFFRGTRSILWKWKI